MESKMNTIRVTEEWQRAGVYYVRTEAMVLGFDLSLNGEFADDTPDGKYILVTDDQGKPLSTNRIHLLPEKKLAKIERVATVSTARGQGAGAAGIRAAESWIRELGYQKIVITSREEAEGFYRKLGYTTRPEMNPDTLELRKPTDPVKEVRDPRFICVYMEKILS